MLTKCTEQILEFGTKIWEEQTDRQIDRTVYRVASQLKILGPKKFVVCEKIGSKKVWVQKIFGLKKFSNFNWLLEPLRMLRFVPVIEWDKIVAEIIETTFFRFFGHPSAQIGQKMTQDDKGGGRGLEWSEKKMT